MRLGWRYLLIDSSRTGLAVVHIEIVIADIAAPGVCNLAMNQRRHSLVRLGPLKCRRAGGGLPHLKSPACLRT
jgi:hypothetical protein